MEFRILGPLEVVEDGRPLPLAGQKQRSLLGALLLHANEVVSGERLIDALWGERPPETAQTALQVHVSQLRKLLGAERIETRAPGYRLKTEPEELDLTRFEHLVAEGKPAEALQLWRGPPLPRLAHEPFAQAELARLEELRLAALEAQLEGELEAGGARELVPALEALVHEQPLRERPRAQLMLALYRSGRQADALRLYDDTRRRLVSELGIEPGHELKELQARILNQDEALAPPPAPAVPERPLSREGRKFVTVLFCDLVDSTALGDQLDPEALRRILGHYFETASRVLSRHGGTVEKFIGDAVVAVFGVPLLHEDDALRAVRAGAALQRELAGESFGLETRIGINSGEVVVGSEPLVTGDAVNLAARFEQAAGSGDVLFGDATHQLVKDAIRAEPVELELKGKPAKVRAWRLVELLPDAPAFVRRLDTSLVGRELELAQLHQALARAIRERRAVLTTVLGPAGIGKTRLAGELLTSVAPEARVLVGRCLSYGDGVTFWPLVEIMRQLAGEEPREGLLDLLALEENPEAIEETFRAVRKLFEALAREQPLVVCFEDIHWAEPTLLDLIDHLADWTSDAPVLLLCLARPELLDEHETWLSSKANATSISLEPLTEQEADQLIERLRGDASLEPAQRERLRDAAGGNPLFVEQMLALLSEEPAGSELAVPPTIQALLATRLERLGPAERAVVERAAVVGQEFWLAAIDHLLDEDEARPLARHVQALVRRDLVRPHRSFLAGEEAFLFNHVLIRDAAYRSISKELRADLHERFASWLEEKGSEYGEIVGYHLEQAWQCRRDLGLSDERTRALGEKGSGLLGEAGGRALQRGDMAAAANLLARAAALLETDALERLEILPKLGSALARVGELERADAVLREAIEGAHARGDQRLELVAMVERSSWRLWSDPWSQNEAREVAGRAIRVFEDAGDELGLAKAWHLLADVEPKWSANTEALERALVHARQAGDRREEADILWWLTVSFYFGPTHADEAIRRCNEILAEAKGDRTVEAGALGILAGLHAMRGQFQEARDMFADGIRILEELGFTLRVATRRTVSGAIELLAGDPVAAERELRWGFERLEAIGEHQDLQGIAGQLAEALYRQGRYDEAERFAKVSETEEHQRTRWRGPHAKLLARRGELERAQSIARATASRAGQSDNLNSYGKALMDLAEVLKLSGRLDEAEAAVQQALGVYEQKGNLIAERAAGVFLEDLQASPLREA